MDDGGGRGALVLLDPRRRDRGGGRLPEISGRFPSEPVRVGPRPRGSRPSAPAARRAIALQVVDVGLAGSQAPALIGLRSRTHKSAGRGPVGVTVMDLPPSAAPRRSAPPQDRLCGRSLASRERHPVASLVAVPRPAPVSVARPRPCRKGATAPGKTRAVCFSSLTRSGLPPINAPHRSAEARCGSRWHTSPAVTSAPGRSGLRDIAQVTVRTPRAAQARPHRP